MIGNYVVQRLVAEGGTGKVYLARHPQIDRQAAVKVLAFGDCADSELVSRFAAEARAANAIDHPSIVKIFDYGVTDSGAPYLVMDYLDGETLTQALSLGPLALGLATDWACQTAEALVAAHAKHIIHRDLKPDNLFLVANSSHPGNRQVKVLDFGIAKLQIAFEGQGHRTRTGAVLGTPLYMSPEQCIHPREIDERSDIYSFGVILYEMVVGTPPFDSESVYAVMHMHVNEQPVPPSTYRPELPPRLEAVILQALAKQPGERQESMAQLLMELQVVRQELSTSASAEAHKVTVRAPRVERVFHREDLLDFLTEIDELLPGPLTMEIVGGAAALLAYGARTPTKDINSFWDFDERILRAADRAKLCIPLARAPSSYLRGISGYDNRRIRLYPPLDNLAVWVPDRHDLLFMKSKRASRHDIAVVEEMHAHKPFDLEIVIERFNENPALDQFHQQIELVVKKLFGDASRRLRHTGRLTML